MPEIAVLDVREARSIRHVPSTAVPLTLRHRFGRGKVPCTGFRLAHFLPVHPEKSTDQRDLATIRRAIEPAESAAVDFYHSLFGVSGGYRAKTTRREENSINGNEGTTPGSTDDRERACLCQSRPR